jgi:hypothetical protein
MFLAFFIIGEFLLYVNSTTTTYAYNKSDSSVYVQSDDYIYLLVPFTQKSRGGFNNSVINGGSLPKLV